MQRLKLDDRINRVLPNPRHSHWLLVSQCSKPTATPAGPVAPQLLLYDQRQLGLQNRVAQLKLFWTEQSSSSRRSMYTVPAWSPYVAFGQFVYLRQFGVFSKTPLIIHHCVCSCGNYVACGTASGPVHIFDVRYADCHRRASRTLQSFDCRVLVSDWAGDSILLTASTQGQLGWCVVTLVLVLVFPSLRVWNSRRLYTKAVTEMLLSQSLLVAGT
eukprot:SAG11_NODE_224_length_12103_cov_8.087054_10_plen_215_part_00